MMWIDAVANTSLTYLSELGLPVKIIKKKGGGDLLLPVDRPVMEKVILFPVI